MMTETKEIKDYLKKENPTPEDYASAAFLSEHEGRPDIAIECLMFIGEDHMAAQVAERAGVPAIALAIYNNL